MQRPPPPTFTRLVAVPENRSALVAVQEVAATLKGRHPEQVVPLYLHGPAGTGKTYLVSALVEEATRRTPNLVVSVLSAGDWNPQPSSSKVASEETTIDAACQCDLLIVEDLQHLKTLFSESLVQVFDARKARLGPMVFTAHAGPRQLGLPARLASRLASGLVVGLKPFQASSRLALLQDKAQRRQLAVSRDVLAWLADHLSGGRQLEGALASLDGLSRIHGSTLDVPTVANHFRDLAEAARPTVERIVQRVGGYFHVDPRQLRSEQRGRKVLLPRQIGMYLARKLTPLSLAQIGTYFGGRDHSTVLHACRKVEQALADDPVLSGTVRQLHAELG